MESLSKLKQLVVIAIAIVGCLPLMAQAGGFELWMEENPLVGKAREIKLKKASEPLQWVPKPNLRPLDCYTYVLGRSYGSSMEIMVEVENNGDWYAPSYEIYLHASSTDTPASVDLAMSHLVYGLQKGEVRNYFLASFPVSNPGPGQSYDINLVISVDGPPGGPGRINELNENDNTILCSETYYGY